MAYEKLNSERVNYLVWRYLQEAGFGQSAARLQRDWGITDPEKLSFAPYIGPHGLIRLLQNGLYHIKVKASLNANSREPVPFFGPEVAVTAGAEEPNQTQKLPAFPQRRDGDSLTNGLSADGALQASTPKRSRRSNGAANGKPKSGEGMEVDETAPRSRGGNEMDIDSHENGADVAMADSRINSSANNATGAASGEADYHDTNGAGSGASHLQPAQGQAQVQVPMPTPGPVPVPVPVPVPGQTQEQQQLIPTLTNGVSVGVQSDKVTDLGPETAVLDLAGKNLTQAAWNPKHATLLAAGGRALCQIWSLGSAALASSRSGTATAVTATTDTATPQNTSHSNLTISASETTELGIESGASVTALAWSPTGEELAYSTFPDDGTSLQRSVTTIWNKDGVMEDQLPGGTEPVVSLAWSPTGRYVAAISGKTIIVFDKKMSTVLSQRETSNTLYDLVWLDPGQFAVCGESIIAIIAVADNKVVDSIVLSQAEVDHDWSQMRYDSHTSTIAVASEDSGYLALVEASGSLHSTRAHEATLTGLTYRPMIGSDAISSMSRRLLATCSVDGTVKLWNARAGLDHVHTFNLGAAALALCFTPDGRHVAAASSGKILFWSAQEGGMPKAIWDSTHLDRQTDSVDHPNHINGTNGIENGEIDRGEEGEHPPSLTWDSNGHKLALACKDKVTIINYYQ